MAAYDWYEGKSKDLGAEFLRVFYAHMAQLQRTPLAYAKVHGAFHRGLLRRFPYACYFQVEDEQIIVFGLFHCARDPTAITRQLQERSVP
jgi:hypothetical protein